MQTGRKGGGESVVLVVQGLSEGHDQNYALKDW